jgi:hypothetical protein
MNMNSYKRTQAALSLFRNDLVTLGEATARAKASVSDQDIRKTWVLFGDPTTRLK